MQAAAFLPSVQRQLLHLMTSCEWPRKRSARQWCCAVQVLAKALEVWGLVLEPLDAPNMRESAQRPEQEDAFICNLQVSLWIPLPPGAFSVPCSQSSHLVLLLYTGC